MRAVIYHLPKKTIEEANLILRGRIKDFGRDETWRVATIRFSDGYEADVKVCGGEPPWAEVVLFDENGYEVSCSEPLDKIDGEIIFKNHRVEILPC